MRGFRRILSWNQITPWFNLMEPEFLNYPHSQKAVSWISWICSQFPVLATTRKRCSCPPHLALCKAGGQHVRYFPWALLVAILLASQWAHLPGIERFWEITRFMSYSCGPHSQPKEMYHMYQLTIKIGQQNRHVWKKGTFFAFRDPQVVEFLFAAFSAHLCRFWIWGQHNPRAPGVVTLQLVETTMVNHRIQLVQGFFHSEYLAISFIWCCFKMF